MMLDREELAEIRRYTRAIVGSYDMRFKAVSLVADELASYLKRNVLRASMLTDPQIRRCVDLAYGAVIQTEDTK